MVIIFSGDGTARDWKETAEVLGLLSLLSLVAG